jgi:DNA-binding TFAR19-related protein (PDSD5 family)
MKQTEKAAQVQDSGHQILQESTKNRWNMIAVSRPEIV